MKAEIAVIGGVGFCIEGLVDELSTPYGPVNAWFTRMKGRRVAFIPRHGEPHLPPHKVNYRAIISAARASGASRVISVNTVGTMSYHPVGSLFLPLDFVEFTKSRINTFFEERAVHVDMSQPYCPEVRLALAQSIKSSGRDLYEGVYACAEGPHLESPAQIRMTRCFGDVIGMTGYPEVVLARELSLCYAALCIVTNEACGMKPEGLNTTEIKDQMKASENAIREIISGAAERMPEERSCPCKDALSEAEISSKSP